MSNLSSVSFGMQVVASGAFDCPKRNAKADDQKAKNGNIAHVRDACLHQRHTKTDWNKTERSNEGHPRLAWHVDAVPMIIFKSDFAVFRTIFIFPKGVTSGNDRSLCKIINFRW